MSPPPPVLEWWLLETPDAFEKAAPIQTDLYLLNVDLVPNRILDRRQLDSHGLDDRESLQSQVVHTEMPAILFGSVCRERSDPSRDPKELRVRQAAKKQAPPNNIP